MTRPISIAIGESLQVEIADLSKFVDKCVQLPSIRCQSVSLPNFQVKKTKNLLSA